MARTIADFITENINTYNILMSNGLIPISIKNQYLIYLRYNKIESYLSQTEKIAIISNEFKVSEKTIYRALNRMREPI